MTGVTINSDVYPLTKGSNDQITLCSNLSDLPKDIRRMLTIQWKEFINSIDDCAFLNDKTNIAQKYVSQANCKHRSHVA